MRTHRSWLPMGLVLLAGCGEDRTGAGSDGHGGPVVVIAVDANRDGIADPNDPEDLAFKNDLTIDHGASFLANLDDDDGDGVRDADDTIINGDEDLRDLARIVVAPWPDAPEGAFGLLGIDPASVESVRVWVKGSDPAPASWSLRGGALDPCVADQPCHTSGQILLSIDEVRRGVELGIEGRRFRTSLEPGQWIGEVDLDYEVADRAGSLGVDRAKMRVAPWVLNGNLSPFDRVWSADDSSEFVSGLEAAARAANTEYERYSDWTDQWTQDFFQTAWTAMPGPGGSVQGMRVANARPWGRAPGQAYLPITWLYQNYLGPDQGILEIYKRANTGTSYDSHGNHDLIPPYEKGDQKFPLGRIFHGSGVLPETTAFYDAQEVQGPHFQVRTSWLLVGHVDEVFSYVPAHTPRGWKLLVASTRRMRQMLLDQQAAGHGSAELFAGKTRYVGDKSVDAGVTIDATLANVDLMQSSEEAQVEIDAMLEDFQNEVGLATDEIIEIPVLMEDAGDLGKVAWSPGAVNLLASGNVIAPPKPFGPVIAGKDIFEQDLRDRLGTAQNSLGRNGTGLEVFFTDDWYRYHILDGEVHCGSNPEAPPSSHEKWWEVAR